MKTPAWVQEVLSLRGGYFMGEEELLRSRGVSVEVLQNEECIRLMQEFIRQNPGLWNEDIGV